MSVAYNGAQRPGGQNPSLSMFDTSGIDRVISSASFMLAAGNGIENLEMRKTTGGTMSNNNGTLTGNEVSNTILGSNGTDTGAGRS